MICHYCQARMAYRYVPHETWRYPICRTCHMKMELGTEQAEIRELEAMYAIQNERGR